MRRIAGVTVALACCASSLALAADTGLYIGGSVGQSYVNLDENTPVELDEEDFAYKIYMGFRASGFFAVEGGYRDLGEVETSSGATLVSSETTAFDAAGLGILKLGIFDLFGKIGVVVWDTDAILGGASVSESDTSALYGVGGAIRLGSVAIRLEYELLDVEVPQDLDMLSIGATLTF